MDDSLIQITPARQRSHGRRRLAAVAATVVMLAAGGGIYWWWLTDGGTARDVKVRTAVGEQKQFTLDDGAVIRMNADSELEIRSSRHHKRRVALKHGEALFTVPQNVAAPFVVTAPQTMVYAQPSIFNVLVSERDETSVSVLAGRVRVLNYGESRTFGSIISDIQDLATQFTDREPRNSIPLHSHQRATITARHRILPDVGPSDEQVKGWPEFRLVFRNVALEKVVEAFNRYNARKMVIADPELARYPVEIQFHTYDLQTFLEYLQRYENVKVEEMADGRLRLSRKSCERGDVAARCRPGTAVRLPGDVRGKRT